MFAAQALAVLLLLIAFLLFLLVSLSVPIIKSIYLFKLVADVSSSLFNASAKGSARFGVWGYCLSAVDVSVVGIDHDTDAQCSRTHLGYTFDSTVAKALHVNGIEDTISRTLTAVLVLHPIVCGFTFLALLSILFFRVRGSTRGTAICAVLTTILAAILATIVFVIDIAGVYVARGKVNDETDGAIHMSPGNAVWMTLGATISLWLAFVAVWIGVLVGRRRPRSTDKY
ncbi:pali-domain-containing protein [Cristinia sonorae]|uniref:Pali-domain-containing protein n=1 Tax=Cristinia sonorae TaxID=1940300 RepID=A0A8K0UY40_9AGAR|nr:pali-domain-containing protein [Cristinia sonorae]